MFERKLGIYVLSASSKARLEEVYVTTVEDTKKAFTKYEVERADRARELLARLGYPSTAKAIQILNSGGIINCDITSSDLLRAEEIYGPSIASLKGKTVKNTATPNKDEEPVIGLQEAEHQTMNVDIMYVKGIPFLLNILTPLRMMFAARLKSKTTQSIFAALTGQISDISARAFKPSKLRCDPEAGFTAMKDTLSQEYGVTVDAVGAGEHVRIVERGIRTIKERVRGIVNTLPFKLCSMLLVLLVLFCVSRINMVPSKADAIVISPWERFHKRKRDYSKNLKAGFGEYSGDESDINFQIGREGKREIDGDPEEKNEDEAYQDYVDQVAKRFITVREHDIVYDPVEASQPDIIQQAESPADATSDGVGLEGVVEAEALQPEDNAGSESSRKDDHMESYEPRRDGLRSARAKPGRYTRKEVGMHLLRDSDSSHRREYGFHMTPEQAIDKLGIVGKRSVVKEVKQLLERKSWHGVHLSNTSEEERKRIIPCKMFVKEKFEAS
eukprot:gene36465-biopygen6423